MYGVPGPGLETCRSSTIESSSHTPCSRLPLGAGQVEGEEPDRRRRLRSRAGGDGRGDRRREECAVEGGKEGAEERDKEAKEAKAAKKKKPKKETGRRRPQPPRKPKTRVRRRRKETRVYNTQYMTFSGF